MGAKHDVIEVAVVTTEPRKPNRADQMIEAGLSKPLPAPSRQALPRQQSISPWWIVFGILLACGFLGAFKLSLPQAGLEDQTKPLLPPERPASPSKPPATPLASPSDPHQEEKGEEEKPQEKTDEKEKPQEPTPPTAPQRKQWEAVDLHQLEEATKFSPDNIRGKKALCSAANRSRERTQCFEGKQRVLLATVALTLSDEGSRDLVGSSVVVNNVKSLYGDAPPGTSTVLLTIDGVVGFGTSSVYVSATTLQGKRFTLRIRVLDSEGGKYSREECRETVDNENNAFSTVAFAQGAEKNLAILRKKCGLLIPLYKGMIEGVYVENVRGSFVIRGEVDFMPPIAGNLEQALPRLAEAGDSAPYARSYIATRLLMQTLYLHQAGLSHNGLCWSNLFVDDSGEVFLSGMDAAASFGEPLSKAAKLDAVYGEPELRKDFKNFREGGSPVKANDKSDMWSLGALLYEVLTGRSFQSLVVNGEFDETSRRTAAHELAHSGVRSAWKDLVLQLLELNREKRISAEGISYRLKDILSVGPY